MIDSALKFTPRMNLSDEDMDKVVAAISSLNSGDLGFHAFVEKMVQISQEAKRPVYITQPAESLMGIALRELGDEKRWTEIRDLNADRFSDMGPHDYYPVGTHLRMANTRPAADLNFTGVAQRKLDDLARDGYVITGYSIEKPSDGGAPRRGFITTGGMVGWWNPSPPQTAEVPADQSLESRDLALSIKDPERTKLVQQLAEQTLQSNRAWARYENANRMSLGLQEERAALAGALRDVLQSEVGVQMSQKLADGHGTETADGRAWAGAFELLTKQGGTK